MEKTSPGHPATHDHDDPNAPSTLYVGLVGTVIFVICVLAIAAIYYGASADMTAEQSFSVDPRELMELRALQRERLEGYDWVDVDKGVLSIPVEEGMRMVIEEHSRKGRGG
ncbi:MAG: hypothetical protein ACE5GW_01435 [Planctomycetota bacterium]